MRQGQFAAASLAIRSCFVDTLSGFKAPSVFLKSVPVLRCPASLLRVRASRVPQPPQYYQSTTTSGADDGVTYDFRFPAATSRLLVRSHAAETSAGPGPAPAAALPAIGSCSYTGSPRFLENPSHTFAPLSDPGRSAQASPSRPAQCSPRFNNSEDTSDEVISGLNHAASVSATYASSRALPHAHARLASGWWLAFAGRESNPLDSIEKFPSSTSDFLLSQIYPGAMLKNSPSGSVEKILGL